MRVLGIDPGIQRMGYGLIEAQNDRYMVVECGQIQIPPSSEFAIRLKTIHETVEQLIQRFRPEAVVIEETYVTNNAKTTLRLGHARGVILLAVVEHSIQVFEYAPREIKQAIVGNGSASKSQVQWMVSQILSIDPKSLTEDAADALAVALCHSFRNSH